MTPQTLTIAIKNELSEIEVVGRWIADFVEHHRLSSKLAFELNLALDEILANVISHGYADGAEGRIDLRAFFADQEIIIEVEDDGNPFNPLEIPAPDLTASIAERPIGGLGIHLVRKLTDGVSYERREGKNVLIINKRSGNLKQ